MNGGTISGNSGGGIIVEAEELCNAYKGTVV